MFCAVSVLDVAPGVIVIQKREPGFDADCRLPCMSQQQVY